MSFPVLVFPVLAFDVSGDVTSFAQTGTAIVITNASASTPVRNFFTVTSSFKIICVVYKLPIVGLY
jgi:hypothetical protein